MGIKYPLLLDGGLSNELEHQGFDLNNKLWTASLLSDYYSTLVDTHYAYLDAGARCIITSSYQASIKGFMQKGYTETEAGKLILKSVAAAEEAREKYLGSKRFKEDKIYIAASIGPYGAFLADGSEYNGIYNISEDELLKFHQNRIHLLDNSAADFFACETIPSFQEAKVLSNILTTTQKKAWISFSCKDGLHINDGTPISSCIQYLSKNPNIFALGVNCTHPRFIPDLINNIRPHLLDKKLVIYPNSGESFDAKQKVWSGKESKTFCLDAKTWLKLGADIVGGCCRVGPKDIAELKELM